MQASFCFLLLLVPVLSVPTTSGHTRPTGSKQTVTTQSSPMSRFIDRSSVSTTSSSLPIHSPASRSTITPSPHATSPLTTSSASSSATTPAPDTTSPLTTSSASSSTTTPEVSFPSSSGPGPGVPGWGIALLVLVCVLVALAIVYLLALAVCQCRRKNCGQLDIFPTRDAYHAMSEYPTYHTHGRYVPPGTSKRSPYEEVSAGNGGSGLSYTNPAATSANL
uniref:Mucin 1, cell surface associated n=1 Tax=Pipistrellus kuhlii TaxID=59472 RepID=A0A7J7UTW2_PIPKU|nr:mucin 1, cell surface associated [Pipistrellus kuhlii]